MSTPGEKRETLSTAVWLGFSPAFLCPGKVCADRGHGADHTSLRATACPGVCTVEGVMETASTAVSRAPVFIW